jgi:hypothetical protein
MGCCLIKYWDEFAFALDLLENRLIRAFQTELLYRISEAISGLF